MAAGDYIHRYALPRFLVRGMDQDIEATVYDLAGTAPELSGPDSYALYSGSTLVYESTAITNPSGGRLVLTGGMPAASTASLALSDRLVERWTVTITGELDQAVFTRPVYLVRHALHPVIDDRDLTALHSDLLDLIDPDQATFQEQRSDAWTVLQKWLIQKGNRPQLIMDDWQLRDVHRFLALENIFADFGQSVGLDGRYAQLADKYREKAHTEFQGLSFTYDYDQDGFVDEEQTKAANPVTFLQIPWGWQ